jgi:hypothetical protein
LRTGCKRIYLGRREERVATKWRKVHNAELNDFYSLLNMTNVVKSRRIKPAGHVARKGERIGGGIHDFNEET